MTRLAASARDRGKQCVLREQKLLLIVISQLFTSYGNLTRISQNSTSTRIRCVTFQSKAPGWAGRPDKVVQAFKILWALEFESREAVIGDDSSHWEGSLELGDVHIAVRRGKWSQTACDMGKTRGSIFMGLPSYIWKTKHYTSWDSPAVHVAWPPRTAHLGLLCSDLLISVFSLFLKQALAFIVASGSKRVRQVGKK